MQSPITSQTYFDLAEKVERAKPGQSHPALISEREHVLKVLRAASANPLSPNNQAVIALVTMLLGRI